MAKMDWGKPELRKRATSHVGPVWGTRDPAEKQDPKPEFTPTRRRGRGYTVGTIHLKHPEPCASCGGTIAPKTNALKGGEGNGYHHIQCGASFVDNEGQWSHPKPGGCAACGMQIIRGDDVVLIEAGHLVRHANCPKRNRRPRICEPVIVRSITTMKSARMDDKKLR